MLRLTAVAAVATLVCDLGTLCAAPEKRIDLAAVVSKKDAESALGEAVKDPQPRNEEGADGYYSRCNYYSQNPGQIPGPAGASGNGGPIDAGETTGGVNGGKREDQSAPGSRRESRARERGRAKRSAPNS